jgi:hypothetical protein
VAVSVVVELFNFAPVTTGALILLALIAVPTKT